MKSNCFSIKSLYLAEVHDLTHFPFIGHTFKPNYLYRKNQIIEHRMMEEGKIFWGRGVGFWEFR